MTWLARTSRTSCLLAGSLASLGLALLAVGCVEAPSGTGDDGSGGVTSGGSGPVPGSGGQVGSGGQNGSGGRFGSGGSWSSGGSGEQPGEGGYGGGNTLPETCEDGDVLPAPDNCNTCTCFDGGWACTLIACAEPDETGCGGWLGNTCTKDEYCAYEEGEWCGAADASSVCLPRPVGCTLEYDPVCGCDGETYSNACTAAAAGTGVYETGPCAGDEP